MKETVPRKLNVISIDSRREKELPPKEAVTYILEDYLKQLKSPDHPDPGFMILITDTGRATFNVLSSTEFLGILELEKTDFIAGLDDDE